MPVPLPDFNIEVTQASPSSSQLLARKSRRVLVNDSGLDFDILVRTSTSGILYTWYKAVQDGMYWYEPVRTLLDIRPNKKPQNGTYQYLPT
jgi:hypothetical protein